MPSDSSLMRRGAVGLSGMFRAGPFGSSAAPPVWPYADLETRLPGLLRLSDWFGIALLGLTIDALFSSRGAGSLTHSLGVVLGATATVNFLHIAHAYSMQSAARLTVQLTKVTVAWTGAFFAVALITVVSGHSWEFWGGWTFLWFAAVLSFLAATRYLASGRIRRWKREGRLVRRLAVFGAGREAFGLAQRLRQGGDEARVVGVFIDGDVPAPAGSVAGDGDRLVGLADAGSVDEIVVAMPWRSPGALNRALSKFAVCQVEVRIDAGIPEIDYPPTEFSLLAGIPTLKVQRRPLTGWDAPLKRFEDLALSLVLLVALLPVLLIIALLVKIDSRGPVLFRQERYGFNNQRIWIFKFRSMHHNPDPDPDVPPARREDPRVTRVGGFLRRTSLDELPQLLNVLRGEMSLVGPRPHAAVHNEKYARLIEGYLGRHRMKPGITGWAQVNGLRGAIGGIEEMKRRLEYDRYYMANWSLLLDIKVLLMTIPAVFRGTNAY